MSPDSIERHAFPERVFHWVMAASVIVCLATAFLPILGLEFAWVDAHWIAGVILTLAVIYHLWRVFFRLRLSDMWLNLDDLSQVKEIFRTVGDVDENKLNKYDLGQKAYHWGTAVLLIGLIISGLLMLIKLDTWFWDRAPGILSDSAWGIVYTVHGIAALVLIMMFMLHLYFSFLPEHRQLLISMVRGAERT